MRRAGAAAGCAAVLLSLAGLASALALAPAQAAPPAADAAHIATVDRFNVAATHSPRLERMLAGRAARPPAKTLAPSASQSAVTATVQGIDVASLQHVGGPIIWTDVAAAGYKFAFIKVSEGTYYVNPYYAADTAGAQAAGLYTAPYAFAIPNYSGGALQADYALDNSGYAPNGKTLPLILDIEYDPYAGPAPKGDGTTGFCYGLTPAQMIAWIGAFITEADRRTGQLPVIYTTAQWWDTCTGGSAAFTADPLWIAGNNSGNTAPIMPAAWTGNGWVYWQYTSSATLSPGIVGDFDASYLSSTALELARPASQSDQAASSPAGLTVGGLDGSPTAATYSATGLPPGMSISPTTGVISGALPATAAAFGASVTATAAGLSATQAFTWDVHGKVSLGDLRSQSGSVGSPVRLQVAASDGLAGCTLQFTASGLPRGLTMSSCGLISGWPQISGEYRITVQLSDSSGTVLAHSTVSWKLTRATSQGPAGQIRLKADGKCLAGRGPTDIAIEPCGSAAAQRWTIAADGSVRVDGDCLAARPAKTTAAAALELTSCSKGGQRWQLASGGVLTNLTDGKCLADTGTRTGSRAVAAPCLATDDGAGSAIVPSPSQQWTLPAGPLTSGIAGFCASDLRGSHEPGGAVTLRHCNGSSQQAWTVATDGALSIGGQCLSLAGGLTAPGTQVRLVRCAKAADQVWQLSGGPIGVTLVSPIAGLCLADPGDRAATGALLAVEPCVAGDPGISWRVS